MDVTDMIKTNFVVCTEDMPLERVFEKMEKDGADHAVVVESLAHSIPIGLITEHDICAQILGRGRNPRGMTAANVMNTNIIKIRSTAGSVTLDPVAGSPRVMCVVDENGALCGMVAAKRSDQMPERAAETTTAPTMVRHFQVSLANRLY